MHTVGQSLSKILFKTRCPKDDALYLYSVAVLFYFNGNVYNTLLLTTFWINKESYQVKIHAGQALKIFPSTESLHLRPFCRQHKTWGQRNGECKLSLCTQTLKNNCKQTLTVFPFFSNNKNIIDSVFLISCVCFNNGNSKENIKIYLHIMSLVATEM